VPHDQNGLNDPLSLTLREEPAGTLVAWDSVPGAVSYNVIRGHVAAIGVTGGAIVLVPPTVGQGARRVWCDSKSRVWVSEWNAGQLARYDGTSWKEWKLPGSRPMAYAVFVDDTDINCDAAEELGMRAVRFRDDEQAIAELEALVRG